MYVHIPGSDEFEEEEEKVKNEVPDAMARVTYIYQKYKKLSFEVYICYELKIPR